MNILVDDLGSAARNRELLKSLRCHKKPRNQANRTLKRDMELDELPLEPPWEVPYFSRNIVEDTRRMSPVGKEW